MRFDDRQAHLHPARPTSRGTVAGRRGRRPPRSPLATLARPLVALVALVTGACRGNDTTTPSSSAAAVTLDQVTATPIGSTDIDGDVVGVSPGGTALVARDGAACFVTLDGTEGPCAKISMTRTDAVRWSPDSQRVVTGSLVPVRRLQDADLAVIDVADASVTTVTDDGTDDATAGPVDLLPTWLDDETVAFLRIVGGYDPDTGRQMQVAAMPIDGTPRTAEVDLELNDLLTWSATYDGRLLLAKQGSDEVTELLAVNPDGTTDDVLSFEGASALIGASSRDGRALAVATADLERSEPGPVFHLRAGEEPQRWDVAAWAATVDPGGELVAAVVGPTPVDTVLQLWNPADGTFVDLGPVESNGAITWTDDDQLVLWGPSGWEVVQLDVP